MGFWGRVRPRVRTWAKKNLAKLLPDSNKLRILTSLPAIETWRKTHPSQHPVFENRYRLYDRINQVLENAQIDYLEFGVFEGASLKYWSQLNTNPDSRFFGFDTFTGLPEDWENFTKTVGKSTFDAKGNLPQLSDKRLSFVKGLFQDTLDDFLSTYHPQRQLVLHNDSDLYSSTLYVLTRCNDILKPGCIIIFDEFSSVLNEFRALEDYCQAYKRKYEVVGVTAEYYAQVAIHLTM